MKCKIVNADNTDANPINFPGFVQIRPSTNLKNVYCAGVKIAPNIVVTAAHCVYKKYPQDLKILMNLSDTADYGYDPLTTNVTNIVSIITHPFYNPNTFVNDIALLYFNPTAENKKQSIAIIPPDEMLAVGSPVLVAGYGTTTSGGLPSKTLESSTMKIIDILDTQYDQNDKTDGNFLAGDFKDPTNPNDNEDTCQGDSGGPAYSVPDNLLLGITSWGNACALDGYPGFYTNLSYYSKWIKNTQSILQAYY